MNTKQLSNELRRRRMRLLVMDLDFFATLSEMIEAAKRAKGSGFAPKTDSPEKHKDSMKAFAKSMDLSEEFANELFQQIPFAADLSFITEVVTHRGNRCGFVVEKIAPLKCQLGLDVRDMGWEEKRRKTILQVCGGNELSRHQISFLLDWLQAESREVIQKFRSSILVS